MCSAAALRRLLLPLLVPSSSSSGGGFSSFLLGMLFSVLITLDAPAEAGHCWSTMNEIGRCTGQLADRISKEECCRNGDASTSWTEEDLDSGRLFFWLALGNGVPNCQPCKDNCKDVECPKGTKCEIRHGQPKCVCAPKCSKKKKGPVCGTDGKTYRNHCHLLKRACRKKKQIDIAYSSRCKQSCQLVTCRGKKQCLLDQNQNPHCVRCSRPCPEAKKNLVCGVDGLTYNSLCHLREAGCKKGHAIPLAYFGECKALATCENVRCGKQRRCLMDMETNQPRCSTCELNCAAFRYKPVCGSDNHTYPTWCHMKKQACKSRMVIETRHSGVCKDIEDGQQQPNCIPTTAEGMKATSQNLGS